jgi:glutamine amidotransferase
MLNRLGVQSKISSTEEDIKQATKLILPGVGHFNYGMTNLKNSGLIEIINQKVKIDKTPILGICLGAQMLGKRSEEGTEKGLGWIDMDIIKFDQNKMNKELKIPHMNWNEISIQKPSKLLTGLDNQSRFYFVHSYHMKLNDKNDSLTTSNYGYEFVSSVEKDNIYGVQFHPEKSHKYGMKILENFAKL